MHARSIAAALALSASLGPGCECVAGLDGDVRLGDAAGTGGGTSTSSVAGGGGPGGDGPTSTGAGGAGAGGEAPACPPMDVPGYPGTDDPGGDVEVVLAVRTVALNDEDGAVVGLNLDAACTCPAPTSCIPHEDTDDDLLCDVEGGIDAQSARIFAQLALLTNDQFSSRELSQDAETGGWSLLLRVEGWTGEPTDSKVRFSMFPSQGLPDDAVPTWGGDDVWTVDATSIGPGGTVDDPLYVDDNAFIVDGVLVASLPQSGIALVSNDSRLELGLVAGFLRARLVQEEGLWAIPDAVLAARLTTTDLFEALDGFRDGNGDPVCTDDTLFGLAFDTICESADIFSGTATPTSPCDAISVGLGFTAGEARLGPVEEPSEGSPGCDAGVEPSRCTCDGGC